MTRQKWFRCGTVYCLRVRRRSRWTGLVRIVRGYIGQTRYRDYRKRVDQHLYGYWYDGEWNPPKYWAHEVVDYYPLWQGERWSDWGLDMREFLCIRVLFPLHNVIMNLGNPRRVVPPPLTERIYPTPDQITAGERYPGKPRRPSIPQWPVDAHRAARVATITSPATAGGVVFTGAWLLRWVLVAVVGMFFIHLGWPGWDTVAGVMGWGLEHCDQLGGLLLIVGGAWFVTTLKPRRRRSKRRRKPPLF